MNVYWSNGYGRYTSNQRIFGVKYSEQNICSMGTFLDLKRQGGLSSRKDYIK